MSRLSELGTRMAEAVIEEGKPLSPEIMRALAQTRIAQAKSKCHIALARAGHARCDRDLDEIIEEVRDAHSERQKWELVLAASSA